MTLIKQRDTHNISLCLDFSILFVIIQGVIEPSRKLHGNCKTNIVGNWHNLFKKAQRSFLEGGALYSYFCSSLYRPYPALEDRLKPEILTRLYSPAFSRFFGATVQETPVYYRAISLIFISGLPDALL